MINLKMQDLNHVKIMAKIEAQTKQEDQVIINSYEGKTKAFRIFPRKKWDGSVVAIIRYTPKVERGDVLRDNGNGKPGTAKSKSKAKSKRSKAK